MGHQRAAEVGAAGQDVQQPGGKPGIMQYAGQREPAGAGGAWSGLRMTALPSASAGATERMDSIPGKLNGEMTATTPIGTCRAIDSRGLVDRSSSPYGAEAAAALSRSSETTSDSSMAALPWAEPASRISHGSSRSGSASRMAAAWSRTAARSEYDAAAQPRWAVRAAATASSRSSVVAEPMEPSTTPVALSVTAICSPRPSVQPLL
jgi:hypothetical protein